MTALWRASPDDSGGWERCRWDGGCYDDDEVRGRPAVFHDPVMRHGDGVFASGACRLEPSLRRVGPVERLTGGGLAVGLSHHATAAPSAASRERWASKRVLMSPEGRCQRG